MQLYDAHTLNNLFNIDLKSLFYPLQVSSILSVVYPTGQRDLELFHRLVRFTGHNYRILYL